MCGTTSPTKAIGPHAATAAPHSRVIATADTTRVRLTLVPSDRAASSPRASAFSCRPAPKAISETDGDEREQLGGHVGVAPGERADGPEAVLVERRLVEQGDGAGERAEQRRQCGAGQCEAHGVGAAASHRSERVDEDRGDRRTDEREPHQPEHVGDREGPDREHDGERGAGVHAEQAGVGQRVAGDALHQRAGHAEGGADHDREHRARAAGVRGR